MKKKDCIFCKLANGEIPANTLYEDDLFRVILDQAPATRGHALLIPKQHAENIYDIDDETAGRVFIVAKKMATRMTERLGCEGFNILQNNGTLAGQTVFHFHMHLIPRYSDDGQKLNWEPGKPEPEEMTEIVAHITE